MRSTGFLLLASVLGAACTAPVDHSKTSPPPSSSDVPSEPEYVLGSVAIVTPNGDATYVCSAAVIGPRTIVSAAHCFKGGNYDKTGWTFELFLGEDVHRPASGDRRVAVVGFQLHPDYDVQAPRADGTDADIAVAYVGEDLDLPPLPWASAALPRGLEGSEGHYVGYGHVDPTRKGKRHVDPARVERLTKGTVLVTTPERNPCHGDSGGPLVVSVDGVDTVIGVGHVVMTSNCTGGADYTRTDLFASFIRAHERPPR